MGACDELFIVCTNVRATKDSWWNAKAEELKKLTERRFPRFIFSFENRAKDECYCPCEIERWSLTHSHRHEGHRRSMEKTLSKPVESRRHCKSTQDELSSRITVSELGVALKDTKENKALGLDGIPSEIIKTEWPSSEGTTAVTVQLLLGPAKTATGFHGCPHSHNIQRERRS